MLLKNFSYGLVSLFLKAGSNDDLAYFKGTQGQNVGIASGTNITTNYFTPVTLTVYNGSYGSISGGSARFCAAYGTGDTPPTIDDYQLSGDLISSLDSTNANIDVNANGITFSHSITNLKSTSVTINEIALCVYGGTGSSTACVMLTRDVLAEPIVLGPNEQRNVSIFIDSNSFVQEVA